MWYFLWATRSADEAGKPSLAYAVDAGHPGGLLPLTRDSAASFHDARLPDNVYVADASLFPEPRLCGHQHGGVLVATASGVAVR